jgi:hypothetical protein
MMAHAPEVKARALALLMLGNNVTYVAHTTGVPKQTVSRWKPEAYRLLRASLAASAEGRQLLAALRGVGWNGSKKAQPEKT